MSVEIGSLLTRSPEIRHGRPCIVGTGISVHRIAILYKMGNNAEEIAREYPHLDIAGIYAALAYYHANQAEVEAEIAADEAEADRIEAEWYRTRNSRIA
jgi:uncharacterized protein (DUF433 family)